MNLDMKGGGGIFIMFCYCIFIYFQIGIIYNGKSYFDQLVQSRKSQNQSNFWKLSILSGRLPDWLQSFPNFHLIFPTILSYIVTLYNTGHIKHIMSLLYEQKTTRTGTWQHYQGDLQTRNCPDFHENRRCLRPPLWILRTFKQIFQMFSFFTLSANAFLKFPRL